MYPLIYAKLFNELWAISPEAHRAMAEAFYLHMVGRGHHEAVVLRAEEQKDDKPPLSTLVASLGGSSSSRNRYLATYGSTAVISMYGILGKHMSSMEAACGGCSQDTLQSAMDIVANSPDLKKVVLDVSSPGGQTVGTQETANMFRALSEVHGKKTYAVTENQMGSAAYWIGSQAKNGLFATPSALVGSIGTYLAFMDTSEEMKNLGRKLEVIKSEGSDFKAMGTPGSTLTEEQRTFLQDHANHVNKQFKSEVSAFRPKIAASDMRGQFFRGSEARKVGYTDGTVASSLSLLRRLT